jgi:lactoylglutathione lyase
MKEMKNEMGDKMSTMTIGRMRTEMRSSTTSPARSKPKRLTAACLLAAAVIAVAGPARSSRADTIRLDADTIRLDNVRLLVARFDEVFLFYRDVLGLTPTWGQTGASYASFAFPGGGGQLAIFRRALMAEAVGAASRPSTRREQDTAALVLAVGDVDAVYRRLRDKGVRFSGEPRNHDAWGTRAAHFRDPDGNLIEIYSAIKKP